MVVISKKFHGAVFTLSLATALLVGVPARAEELKRVAEKVFPLEPGGEVRIDDKNGKLIVEAWPRREVRIQITRVVRAENREKAEALMKELQADVEVRQDRIDIQSRFPKRWESMGLLDLFGRRNANVRIDYYVQVPQETDLHLGTTNGEIRGQGTSGRFEALTTNGDIHLAQMKGTIEVSTTNGEVRLEDLTGQASARTTNGSVIAEIRRLPSQAQVNLETTNGNVEAYFDRDLKADLEATTTNGNVMVDFPISRAGVMSRRTIRGTIQGGGAKIIIQTTNGNVDVRRIGDRRS